MCFDRVDYVVKDVPQTWLRRLILDWLERETGVEFVQVDDCPVWYWKGYPFPKPPADEAVCRALFFMRSSYPGFPAGGAAIERAFVVCIEDNLDVEFHRSRTFHEFCHAAGLPADDMRRYAPGCFPWYLRLMWYIYRLFGWNVDIPMFQIAYYRWLWRWCRK